MKHENPFQFDSLGNRHNKKYELPPFGRGKSLREKKKCRPPSLTLRLHVCKEYVLSRRVEQCRRPFSQKYGKAVELGGIIETLSHET